MSHKYINNLTEPETGYISGSKGLDPRLPIGILSSQELPILSHAKLTKKSNRQSYTAESNSLNVIGRKQDMHSVVPLPFIKNLTA